MNELQYQRTDTQVEHNRERVERMDDLVRGNPSHGYFSATTRVTVIENKITTLKVIVACGFALDIVLVAAIIYLLNQVPNVF